MSKFDWKKTLATVAPALATALGGPMAGVAVSMAGKALGLDNASEQDIAEAVASGDPNVLVKLREVDTQFKLEMKRLDVNLQKIASDDRISARLMRQAMGGAFGPQEVLATIYTIGYFGMVYMLFDGQVTIPEAQSSLGEGMVAIMTAAQLQILNFYFGSSAGSKQKAEQMAGMIKA